MAPRYTFPTELDSDDEGSVGYHTDDESNQSDYAKGSGASGTSSNGYPPWSRTTQGGLCTVCNARPQFINNSGRRYPTCGLTCAAMLQSGSFSNNTASASTAHRNRRGRNARGSQGPAYNPTPTPPPTQPPCVVCKTTPSGPGYVTCNSVCAEKLFKDGGDPAMCDYCHRRPRVAGKLQCGLTCAEKAKVACLLCKCRPKHGRYHLCGKTCKRISTEATPLILEVPKEHKTFEMVKKKFANGWKAGSTPPVIQKIFKIIENDEFLQPYDVYRQTVGNEHFRYHGTRRQCQLGISTTIICTSTSCAVCSILRTSFKVSLANHGSFGKGIYSSSASSKAYGYTSANGVMLLTKVVLGKIYPSTNGPAWSNGCPPGYNSVVYDNPAANETIVYTDDAIRPIFLIVF